MMAYHYVDRPTIDRAQLDPWRRVQGDRVFGLVWFIPYDHDAHARLAMPQDRLMQGSQLRRAARLAPEAFARAEQQACMDLGLPREQLFGLPAPLSLACTHLQMRTTAGWPQ